MKIAVIGGAGVRTPLLVGGLTASDLPIDEVALYDVDRDRLKTIGGVAAQMAVNGRVTLCETLADCASGAQFVFTSIRVGGSARRAQDEAVALRHGVIGQETIGPAGFAMATRTIPHVVRYAREIDRLAPDAWIINFTNPVGIVTEAMRTVSARVIGICDTPTELFDQVARTLHLDAERCYFDYFGLNHLGWLREVYDRGQPQLHRLWNDAERLRSVYRVPLFAPSFLSDLKLLPTEYVFYYTQAGRALDNVRRAGQSRGQVVDRLNRSLFDALQKPGVDVTRTYGSYLAVRNAGYMQLESGSSAPVPPSPPGPLSGYDKIALGLVRAIQLNLNAIVPLNVPNRGTIADLLDDDVVEVPCVVNANGARPMHAGAAPDSVRPLLQQVKAYERLTVDAGLTQSFDRAREALAANPLVIETVDLDGLIDDLSPLW